MTPTPRQRQWATATFAVALALWTWKLLEPSPVPESLLGDLRSWAELLPFLLAKTLHVGGYAFLGFLAMVWPPARWKAALVGFLLVHGATTELLQYLLPFNRVGRVADVLLDWVGIAMGVTVYWLAARRNRARQLALGYASRLTGAFNMVPILHLPDGTCSDSPRPLALLPGSFNPLHHGHRALAEAAASRLGVEVHYELSVANADKPDLSSDELTRRLEQFRGLACVWVTRAATFEAKAGLFPGAAFVLGFDTAVRLIDPRFYAHDPDRRDVSLRSLKTHGCRLLVAGRVDVRGEFRSWHGEVADEFRGLFEVIPESEFRVDVSSTKLRV